MARRKRRDGLVYSTDPDRMAAADDDPGAGGPVGDGRVRVRRESKGRKGKTVTVVTGLALDPLELAELARDLKQACGTGGTVKDGVVEIQGDNVDRVVELLVERGHDARRAGG